MNAANHLRIIDRACEIIASYPEMKGIPVIVGESDPDGCAACSAPYYPQNSYRNGAQYASYTAATFLRKQAVAERHGIQLKGAVTWAFLFPDQPWFDGFRTLSTHGIAKPVLNVFRMFGRLGSHRVAVSTLGGLDLTEIMQPEARGITDVDAVASIGEQALSIIVWHHHDSNSPGDPADVDLSIQGLPEGVGHFTQRHFRIDFAHGNSYTAWLDMEAPQNPTPEQYASLEKASRLTLIEPSLPVALHHGSLRMRFELPRHAVSLIELEW